MTGPKGSCLAKRVTTGVYLILLLTAIKEKKPRQTKNIRIFRGGLNREQYFTTAVFGY